MKRYYLAYGSNLNLSQMKMRCPNSNVVGKTILKDYQLVYKGTIDSHAYLTIEQSKGSYVPVGIYRVSFLDEWSLNRYEGYPSFYDKKYIPVSVNGNIHNAFIYIMNSNFSYHLPSQHYIDVCMEGYKNFGFQEEILENALDITKEKLPKKFQK